MWRKLFTGNSRQARRMRRGPASPRPADRCMLVGPRGVMIHTSKSPANRKRPGGATPWLTALYPSAFEEEFQIIDPATCELRSHVSPTRLRSFAGPSPSRVEARAAPVDRGNWNAHLRKNVSGAWRIEMHRTRGRTCWLARGRRRAGLQVAAAGTPPVLKAGSTQVISPGRNAISNIVEEMGQLARSHMLIFGMHVHVGHAG